MTEGAKHCRGRLGAEGVKTTENKIHLPRWLAWSKFQRQQKNVVFFTISSSMTVTITKITCGMSYVKVQQLSRKQILYTIAKIAKEINVYMKKRFCLIKY
jgi:hypothetical protein